MTLRALVSKLDPFATMPTSIAKRYQLINLRNQPLVVHADRRTVHIPPHGQATVDAHERALPQVDELRRRRMIAIRPIHAVVNINTATVDELDALDDIGPATARQIVAHREEHGRFARPEEIQDVSGVGPATYRRIADRIIVR
jgi:comEA protein